MREVQPLPMVRPALLHGSRTALCAPTLLCSAEDGSMPDPAAHGVSHGDWRWIRSIDVHVDGGEIEHIATSDDEDRVVFHGIARQLDGHEPVAQVVVERARHATPDGFSERVTLVNGRDVPLAARLDLTIEVELAPLADVRAADAAPSPVELRRDGDAVVVDGGARSMRLSVRGGSLEVEEDGRIVATRHEIVRPGDWSGLTVEATFVDASLHARAAIAPPRVIALPHTRRPALDRWVERASGDLADLLLDAGHGPYLAAGAPWDLTLVARDALIAARLLLPSGGGFAEGTLRSLAALQGTAHDPSTGEQPGRIPHRLRRAGDGEGAARIFEAMDATPLWMVLLHDAWRAGMPAEAAEPLVPALEAALGWLARAVGDDFLRLEPARQDHDWRGTLGAVRHHDGSLADEPVAPVELQGLACLAAASAASMLEAFGRDGEPGRALAAGIRERFRASFWVWRGDTEFPAMALDGAGAPVDALCSSIGQLVGTTLLTLREERKIAALLLDDRLSSGFGLRSLATDAAAYWPLAPYAGAVWPHETAIAIEGLLRRRMLAPARALAAQLERAAGALGGQLPECFAGYGLDEVPSPLPIPGAAGPRAASAASVVPVHAGLVAPRASARAVAPMSDDIGAFPLLRRADPRGGA